jgi:hypothetical protein
LPHVILTSELECTPSILDHAFKEDEQWGESPTINSQFDDVDKYALYYIIIPTSNVNQDGTTMDNIIDQCIYGTHMSSSTTEHEGTLFYDALQSEILEAPTSLQALIPKTTIKRSPLFGWMSADIIKKTFEHTAQYTRLPTGTMLKKAFRSPHPALNV